MARSSLRAAFCGAVSSFFALFLFASAVAQTADDRTSKSTDDPVPAEVHEAPAPADGHAASEGVLESLEAKALEAFVLSQQTQALRAAIAETESTFLERLAALQSAFDQARDDVTAMDLQRQIEVLKFEHEVDLVLVQAEHARAMGREQLADEAQRVATQLRENFRAQHRQGDVPAEGANDGAKQE